MLNSKKIIIPVIAVIFIFLPCPAEAKGAVGDIKWERLNLTQCQRKSIRSLDMQWQGISLHLRQKIIKDQRRLRCLLGNQFVTEEQLRKVYYRILRNQRELRKEALENFIKKRRILNYSQKKTLHNKLLKSRSGGKCGSFY